MKVVSVNGKVATVGGKVLSADSGVLYDSLSGKLYVKNVVVPPEITFLAESVYAIDGIETIYGENVTAIAHYACGKNNTTVKSINLPKLTSFYNYLAYNCSALEEITLGSIGHPVTSVSQNNWLGTVSGRSSSEGFTVTLYVNATTIAEIPQDVTRNPMGGSAEYCSAVIYRNSTTGEVIEQ